MGEIVRQVNNALHFHFIISGSFYTEMEQRRSDASIGALPTQQWCERHRDANSTWLLDFNSFKMDL